MKSNRILNYLILSLFFLITHIHPEGFLANTLIKTASGYAYIEQLQPKDSILSYRIDDSEVSLHSIITYVNNIDGNFFIQISIDNTKICCAPDQQFYSYNKQQWIRADTLTLDDLLMDNNGTAIAITSLEYLHQTCTFYALTLDTNHTYYVSEHNIVVHNTLPLMITSTFSMVPATVPIIKTVCTTAAAFFGIHLFNFAKKLWRKCRSSNLDSHRSSSSYNNYYPDPNDPHDDNNTTTKNEHPHGIYRDAPYHHKNSYGNKSRCPNDGQRCLDYSLPTDTQQRIAIEGKNFFLLKRTCPGQYHGHMVEWKELDQSIRAILIKRGLVKKSGKIIKQIIEKSLS